MQNNDEILSEFILEAREILDLLDAEFIRLEKLPDDKKLIGNIFRALHTLKGSSGFFAFKRLEKISHAGESLLGMIRDGQISLDPEKVDRLLETVDVLRIIIEGIEKSHSEPTGNDQVLIGQLQFLAKIQAVSDGQISQKIDSIPLLTENEASIDSAIPFEPSTAISDKSYDISTPVKVNLDALDRLMNLTSEMVLARNRLLPFANGSKDLNFSQTVRSIDLLTLELQERMMKMRMQPISYVWSKFSRLVRDLSRECNKQINLIQLGSETELDRALLDAIRDPLIHILRNSIDHSIETPEERKSKGKSEVGSIQLSAFHQNGMVVIEIVDDGAGINYERVRSRAIERRLVDSVEAEGLTNDALIELIFLPGFSTKDHISSLSGRGVGMDVVKNKIISIGGSIELTSESNIGTTIRLKIPLTLAIIPALLVGLEEQTFAIPENRILELARLIKKNNETPFEDFYGTPVYRLRENLIPVLYLNNELKLNQLSDSKSASINMVVVQSDEVKFGIIVDAILNIQDVVVKPLGPLLNNLPKYAGATILGSGRISLILDVDGIAVESGLAGRIRANPIHPVAIPMETLEEEVSMLLFELNGLSRIALPLECIEHILMLNATQFQENGDKEAIYYKDLFMHAVRLQDYVSGCNSSSHSEQTVFPALTCNLNHKTYALIVKQVHDIIQVPKKMHELSSPQRGIQGCIIYKNDVINILDLEEVIAMHNAHDSSTSYPRVIDIQGVLD
jgi:two-component system chemotaxis sensor kinase CheA